MQGYSYCRHGVLVGDNLSPCRDCVHAKRNAAYTKNYTAGKYELQWRGRGIITVELNKMQAKAMFEVQKKISHEFIGLSIIE